MERAPLEQAPLVVLAHNLAAPVEPELRALGPKAAAQSLSARASALVLVVAAHRSRPGLQAEQAVVGLGHQ